jgi:RNA-directed DNA polymerase
VISPLLSNVYLHELDLRWHQLGGPRHSCNARLVRYADDFVVLARYIGSPVREFLTELLEGKMGLRLHPDKTRILNLREAGESLDFLGYTFRFDRDPKGGNHRYLNWFPSNEALKRRRAEVKKLTSSRNQAPLPVLIGEMNRSLRSWGRFFADGYPIVAFRDMDEYVRMRMWRFLQNRSQRRMEVPKGMTLYGWLSSLGLVRLGDPRTIAELRGRRS